MRTFFLSVGFTVLAAVVAFFIPRTLISELRWEVAWEHRLAFSGNSEHVDSAGVPTGDRLIATTATAFSIFDASDGRLVRLSHRASQFTASDTFFINQPLETPRWAVEKWGQNETRFFEAVGVPEIDGDVLVQRMPDAALSVTDLESPFEDRHLLPSRAAVTGYDLCAACDVPTVVRGDLYGTIELFRWPEGIGETVERLEYTLETPPFSQAVPVVYAVKALNHDRLVALVGLRPQRLIVLAEDTNGNLRQNAVFEVSRNNAVRSPVGISDMAGESAAIPLRSQVVLYDYHNSSFASVRTRGVTAVHGGFPVNDATAFALSTVDGAAAGLLLGDETDAMLWVWNGADIASVRDQPQDGLVVVHRDGLVVAMRIAL